MYFASDNWAGAAHQVNEAIVKNSAGFKVGYNSGELDKAVQQRFCEIFQTDVSVFFVATGTAANSISIALTAKPGSVCFGHEEAHILVDECGGPEFFSAGRLCAVSGKNAKIDPSSLEKAIANYPEPIIHHGRPGSISISQATELGTVYSLEEIDDLVAIAKSNGMPVHMDGARFANALVSLETTPAEMTWKRGVDLLSFGGTKNGCWCAEAVVCFRPEWSKELAFHHKRAGQLFSKSRFMAAQFEAYLANDNWLTMARHANSMTGLLSKQLKQSGKVRLLVEPQANETFAIIKTSLAKKLHQNGAHFFKWLMPASMSGLSIGEDEDIYRFITSFATTTEHIDEFSALLED